MIHSHPCTHVISGTNGAGTNGSSAGTTTWFLASLQDPARPRQHVPDDEPVMPSVLSNRANLVKLIEGEKLKFHSIKHAQFATRRIVETLLQEQQEQQAKQQV